MVDEGLWLVCYEVKYTTYRGVKSYKASFTLIVPEKWSSKKLWEKLEEMINSDSFAITNMVRLGDLKSNE